MAEEIKQKIVLEGEKQYNQALKDAQRNLKTLRSELKAETAELGKNATEQQKAAVKTKNLQQQIKEQEQIVKTYKEALEEVRKQYGDNEDAIAKWEVKLNDARTALANMRSSLDAVGDGFADVKDQSDMAVVAAKSVADAFKDIGTLGETISSGIEGAISGVVDTVRNTISQVWTQIVDLAARSNNMVDLAGYWNTSTTTIQKYAGAVKEASGTLEDINSLVTKINSMDGNKIAELTGVSDEKYEDKWQYAMAVMDAMSKMDHKTRNETGFEIFGKGAVKAFDLLNDWAKVQENLDKYDPSKGGYGLSEEDVQQMSDLYDKVNGLLASWQALKDAATVKLFGSLAFDLTGNAQAILDALLKYFNAENDSEREEALQEVEDNIVAAFERIGDAIQKGVEALRRVGERLQSSEDPVVRAIGDILVNLTNAFQWLIDNQDLVKGALEFIFGAWLLSKIAKIGSELASLILQINTIRAWKGIGDVVNGTPTTPTAPTTPVAPVNPTAGTDSVAKGPGPVAILTSKIKDFAAAGGGLHMLVPGAVALGAVTLGTLGQKYAENKAVERQKATEELVQHVRESIGNTLSTRFMENAANALGPHKLPDGSYERVGPFGLFMNMNQTSEAQNMLMGLKSRNNQQKAELYNMINSYAAETDIGWTTWGLLTRLWENNDLSAAEEDSLLRAILKAEEGKVQAEMDKAARMAEEHASDPKHYFEDVLLEDEEDGYTDQEKTDALQDWWDAFRNNDLNPNEENAQEEENAFAWFQEVFGDAWGDVYDSVLKHLDEVEDQAGLEDIPANWWETQQSTMTQLTNMPKEVEGAAERGITKGMSGVNVYLDGSKVGQMVAPYVNQVMASDLGI